MDGLKRDARARERERIRRRKKKKRNHVRHDNVSHSKCFLPLKRMIFFLSVTLSTIEMAHDQDSTVLITEPRVSFGLQPAMRINDAMSRMRRTLRTASTIVNAASFAFIPLIFEFRLITVPKQGIRILTRCRLDGPIYGTTDDANEPRICESGEYFFLFEQL